MSKKKRSRKSPKRPAANAPPAGKQKQGAKYSAGEIAMAVLGAALLIMVVGIVITSLVG